MSCRWHIAVRLCGSWPKNLHGDTKSHVWVKKHKLEVGSDFDSELFKQIKHFWTAWKSFWLIRFRQSACGLSGTQKLRTKNKWEEFCGHIRDRGGFRKHSQSSAQTDKRLPEVFQPGELLVFVSALTHWIPALVRRSLLFLLPFKEQIIHICPWLCALIVVQRREVCVGTASCWHGDSNIQPPARQPHLSRRAPISCHWAEGNRKSGEGQDQGRLRLRPTASSASVSRTRLFI